MTTRAARDRARGQRRATVIIGDDQDRTLTAAAVVTGRSRSEIVRDGIELVLAALPARQRDGIERVRSVVDARSDRELPPPDRKVG